MEFSARDGNGVERASYRSPRKIKPKPSDNTGKAGALERERVWFEKEEGESGYEVFGARRKRNGASFLS